MYNMLVCRQLYNILKSAYLKIKNKMNMLNGLTSVFYTL